MSYPELQIEEPSVQLTEEDIQKLSEYSWDMAGYTSRFGFSYMGNEKAELNGLTRWQAEHVFQLTPTSPGMEDPLQDMEHSKHFIKGEHLERIKKNEIVGDEYLSQALNEKELRYLSFFLHAYENRINKKVYSLLRRNGMDTYDPALFLDLKLACQEMILKKLLTFDPGRGVKFLTFAHEFILDAFISFRMREEAWQMGSLDTYKATRRMAAILNANDGNQQKAIDLFCEEAGYQPDTAQRYLEQAVGIRARQGEVIIDRDENDTEIMEDILHNPMGNLCYVVWNSGLAKAVRSAMEKLSWRDQTVLKARNAICNNCGGVQPMREQYSFREISYLINCSTDKGAEKAYRTAVDHLTAQMAKENSIRILDLVQEKVIRTKKKNAAAIYRYQADCDGEWGEIYLDFENSHVKILKLAEWDTTKSHMYAMTAIPFILRRRNESLPKKKRIVFDR